MKIFEIEKNRTILVIGSGGSIKSYRHNILDIKNKTNAITLGVNAMTSLLTPDYHLWTNRKQYSNLGSCISKSSKLLIGSGIKEKLVKKHCSWDYISINYKEDCSGKIKITKNLITGPFRTAGVLSIVLSHVMGSNNIFVVGMDGYTLYSKKELESGDKNQHCYGSGYTDDADWEKCIKKDEEVYSNLRKIKEYGIDFKIITPTKFEEFYDCSVLKLDML